MQGPKSYLSGGAPLPLRHINAGPRGAVALWPFFGVELLGMARDVAAFNLPARVGNLFGVSL